MENAFDFSKLRKRKTPQKIIMIGDFLKDLDDEHALCGMAGLIKLGLVEPLCVVANLDPAELRARGAAGTLEKLGLDYVPVGIGEPVYKGKSHPYETNIPYLAERYKLVSNGKRLMVSKLMNCPDKSVTLILQSALTDAEALFVLYPNLTSAKIKNVVIMGGVETIGDEVKLNDKGMMVPNNANNNSFDMLSANWLFSILQERNIPMTIVTREVAFAAQVPFSAYDEMEKTGNPVAMCLKNRQKPMVQNFWEASCSPAGSAIRGTLPADRDRAWFVKAFCDGKDPGIEGNGDIWPHVGRLTLYDPANLYAAVPSLRSRFFKPKVVRVDNTNHLVIGVSKTEHGVKNPSLFAKFMVDIEILGLQK
jgi:inosine-uridine nucleoside N-ribohydrolase